MATVLEHKDKKSEDRHDIVSDSQRVPHSDTNAKSSDSNVCDVCGKEMKSEKSVRYHKLRKHSKGKSKKKTPKNDPKDEPIEDDTTNSNSVLPQYEDELDNDESDESFDNNKLDDVFEEIKNTSTKEYPSILLQMGKTLRKLGCSYPDTKQILTLMEDADPDNLDDFMEVSRDVRLNTNLRRMFVQKWAKIRGLKIGRDIERILGITRKHDYSYDDNYDDEDDSNETQVTSSTNEFAQNLEAVLNILDRTNLRGNNNTDPETQRQIEELKIQNVKLEEKLEREQTEKKFENMINEKTNSFKEEMEKLRRENTDLTTEIYRDFSKKMDSFLAVRQRYLTQSDEEPPYKKNERNQSNESEIPIPVSDEYSVSIENPNKDYVLEYQNGKYVRKNEKNSKEITNEAK